MKIIGIDVDGTLTENACWTEEECQNATPRTKVIEKVREISAQYYIVISTARRVELATATIKWLYKHDVPFNAIDFRKTAVDLLVDDLAVSPEEFLEMDLSKRLYDREPYP